MALPVYTRTWSLTHYIAAASGDAALDNRNATRALINALVTTGGWTVLGSSTSVSGGSYGFDGVNRWLTNYTGDNWIVLGHSGKSLCFQARTGSVTYEYFHIFMSLSSGYSGGGVTTRPTASDEIAIAQNPEYFLIGEYGSNTSRARRLECWCDSQSGAFRIIPFYNNPAVEVNGYILMFDAVGDPRSELSVNAICEVLTPDIASFSAATNSAIPLTKIDGIVSSVRMTAIGNSSGWLVEQTPYATTLPDGEWAILPASYWVSTNIRTSGIVGKCVDWFFIHPNVASGTTLPSDGSKTHIVFRNMVLPWDGTSSWS